jgi:hypothetical protein
VLCRRISGAAIASRANNGKQHCQDSRGLTAPGENRESAHIPGAVSPRQSSFPPSSFLCDHHQVDALLAIVWLILITAEELDLAGAGATSHSFQLGGLESH